MRKETGYYKSGLSTNDRAANRQIVDAENAARGVTKAQEAAMLHGSLFGWKTKGADPRNYEDSGKPIPNARKQKVDGPER